MENSNTLFAEEHALAIVKSLVDKYPDGCTIQDTKGWTPLNLMVLKTSGDQKDMIPLNDLYEDLSLEITEDSC